MKIIFHCAVVLYGLFLNTLVLASVLDEKYMSVKNDIQIRVAVDCESSSKRIDFILYVKNKGDDSIYFSNGFLGLTPQLLDMFSIAHAGNKKSVAYTGVYEWKRESQQEREQYPYVLEKQKEIFIRYPVSRFYPINLDSNYEITQTIVFYMPNRSAKFVGFFPYSFSQDDCMVAHGDIDTFKSVTPSGIYVNY